MFYLAATRGSGGGDTLNTKMAKRDEARELLSQLTPVSAHPASVDLEGACLSVNHHRGFAATFRTVCNAVPGSHGASLVNVSVFWHRAGAESAYKCGTTVLST